MKYKVQEHIENVKEFIIYECAANGEICRNFGTCKDEKDALYITSLLNNTAAKVNYTSSA